MDNKDSFYFKSNDKFIKTVNIDSPSFIGTPIVPIPKQGDYERIVNLAFVKSYIEKNIHNFKFHNSSVIGNELTLDGNKEYIINITGLIDIDANDPESIQMGYIVICDNDDNVIESIDDVSESFISTGGLMQSGSIVVRTPLDGIVRGYVNYDGYNHKMPANHMTAIKVDRDDYVTVQLLQKPNQTMYFNSYGESYSDQGITISDKSIYEIKVIPEIGYIPGNVTPNTSGVLDGDTSFNITDAVYSPCIVTINQTPNQTIYVEFEDSEYTESFIGRYGGSYTARIESNYGYNPGTLSTTSGDIFSNITISATPAKAIYKMITIIQKEHQTITLTRMDTGEKSTVSFNVPQGVQILAEIESDDDYLPGELNVEQFFTVDDNITITATDPIPRT